MDIPAPADDDGFLPAAEDAGLIGAAEDSLQTVAPALLPNGAHRAHAVLGVCRSIIGVQVFQDIEADWVGEIPEIEVAAVVVARGRDEPERIFGEVAVRVNQEEAITTRHILRDEVLEARRFPDTGRAERRHVAQALLKRDADYLAIR